MLSFQSIAHLIPRTQGKIVIAYSGGIDSQVLLHLCAHQADLKPKIVAVYVHHGLQAAADAWESHCRQQTEALGVAFICLKVDAQAKNGESPEAAARHARYQALQGLLQSNEDLLLLAQHREDQLETVLLQLFRGAGVQGLAAMPASAPFGPGTMLRPLLNVAKAEIQAYAMTHELQWVEDPSNQSHDFDRNYLRHAVIPLLKQRWPALDKTVARSAQHCAEAAELLNAWGCDALADIVDPKTNSLSIARLSGLSETQTNWLIRLWLQSLGLKPPSQAQLQSIKKQLIDARSDANPQISIQHHTLKRYRQALFLLPASRSFNAPAECYWQPRQSILLLTNGFALTRLTASSGIEQTLWHASKIVVKPRSGGEKLKLPGRDGQHCLKKLYQEAGIPPWERDTRPLLYLNGRLAAVPGLWVAEWAWHQGADACYHLTWQAA